MFVTSTLALNSHTILILRNLHTNVKTERTQLCNMSPFVCVCVRVCVWNAKQQVALFVQGSGKTEQTVCFRLKQTQQIIRWFLHRSGKANASHKDYLNSPQYLHNTTAGIIVSSYELWRSKPLIWQRGIRDLMTHALPLRHWGKRRLPASPGGDDETAGTGRKTSRPRGGAAPPGPDPAPAPRLLGRAGPRPPHAGVTPSMQRGALLPLPPLPLPGGEDGGGRRGGSGDPAHGRRGAAQNRPPQGRHLVRDERGGSGGPARAAPPAPGRLGCRRDRPPSPRPPAPGSGSTSLPLPGKWRRVTRAGRQCRSPRFSPLASRSSCQAGSGRPGAAGPRRGPGCGREAGRHRGQRPAGEGREGAARLPRRAAEWQPRMAGPQRAGGLFWLREEYWGGEELCYQAVLPLSRLKWPLLHLRVVRNDNLYAGLGALMPVCDKPWV